MPQKAHKLLTYCAVIWYKVIDKEKCYCQKDPKENDFSVEMKGWSNGYTGCGLDDFDKKGEQRQDKFKFQNPFSEKAWAFFKSVKFLKDLIQPIRD